MLEDLGKLHAELAAALPEDAPENAPSEEGDPEALARELTAVRELLDAFEGDVAAEILRDLARRDYGAGLNGALRSALKAVDEFDCDRAVAALDGL